MENTAIATRGHDHECACITAKGDVTVYHGNAPALTQRISWTEEEKAVIKNSLVPGAPDAVFKYFLAAASVMGLNPLQKEIYIVPYGDEQKGVKWVLQQGIDGLYRHAWDSGRLQGFNETMFTIRDADGKISEIPMRLYDPDSGVVIVAATASMSIITKSTPVTATCHFKRYAKLNDKGELQSTWNKFPERMIEKCAQAKLIRENIPGRSNVYIPEEMGGMDEIEGFDAPAPEPRLPGRRQRRIQHPILPTDKSREEPIQATATVVEPESKEEPGDKPTESNPEPTEADGDPDIVAYLKQVTDGMRNVYKAPPDGIHHMNRLLRREFDVDEPWMIGKDQLEALKKFCKGKLLSEMESSKWIVPKGKK